MQRVLGPSGPRLEHDMMSGSGKRNERERVDIPPLWCLSTTTRGTLARKRCSRVFRLVIGWKGTIGRTGVKVRGNQKRVKVDLTNSRSSFLRFWRGRGRFERSSRCSKSFPLDKFQVFLSSGWSPTRSIVLCVISRRRLMAKSGA